MLTDTGEDSRLVHRQKRPKEDMLFFSDASERRVWLNAESKILASTFGRFRLYRLTNLLRSEMIINFTQAKTFPVKNCYSRGQRFPLSPFFNNLWQFNIIRWNPRISTINVVIKVCWSRIIKVAVVLVSCLEMKKIKYNGLCEKLCAQGTVNCSK